MLRNLILVFGLALALTAFGCDSSSTGSGGNGGNGGSGGVPPMDACTNQADLTIVCDDQFDLTVRDCASNAKGDGKETSQCLQQDTGVSDDCADCYGLTTECTVEHCVDAECATAPFGDACTACRVEFCVEAFDECRGDLVTGCAG
jgi:hypothetical protein